tara:strand:+ start:4974 stop:5990 length:1017 start_codon:yes stop_codon:yes gene_type:complete
MKKQNIIKKFSFLKKAFIKLCRLFGYEIIDQSNYEVPTLNKKLNETLSIPGKKSITIPMGEIKIKEKIQALKIIFRSSTGQLIMDQSKERIFGKDKNEYTFRSLNSILKSVSVAKKKFNNLDFELIVTDTHSKKSDLSIINSILKKFEIKNNLIEINTNNFKDKIFGNYSPAKFSNMSNLYTSLNLLKENPADLVYFVEDDYIHTRDAISEMLFTYEKFRTILNQDLFLVPADYPYLYSKDISTKILLGNKKHWRLIDESLVTFMSSKETIINNFDKLLSMAQKWEDPWESPLHEIYKKTPCFSPIPSLAIHCANINSVFGLSPNVDWKLIWDENKEY